MIDIHPPEHTPHTWRDFFIHIATIVIGLVIAIGLEQTVVAIQHVHERRALIADMHAESAADLPIIRSNFAFYRAEHAWELASIAAMQRATPSAGFVTVTFPSLPRSQGTRPPPRSVWQLAKSNGQAALLPEQLGEFFDLVDTMGVQEHAAFDNRSATHAAIDAITLRLPGQPEYIALGAPLRLSLQQRDDLEIAFSKDAVAMDQMGSWLIYWNAAAISVLNGVQRPQDFRFPHQYLESPGELPRR